MTTWNYRVLRKTSNEDAVSFHIHEVYYDESGDIEAWSQEPVEPFGESQSELREDIRYFLSAFRRQVLEETTRDGKASLQPAYEDQPLNDGHYFEAMDRVSVALDHCVEFVGHHPVIRKHPELSTIFERAEDALAELYQAAARLEFDRTGG